MNKLGPHCIKPSAPAISWAARAGIVKAVDEPTPLNHTKAPIRIFRKYFPDQSLYRTGADVAREVLAALGSANANFIELYNECYQRLDEGLDQYVRLTREAVAYVRQVRPDLKVIGFNFSTGSPEPEDWRYLQAHNYGDCDAIGIHAYWNDEGFSDWHAFRHRKVAEWLGGNPPQMLITECGRDNLGDGKAGWKTQNVTAEQYAAELREYAIRLEQDPYVLGAVAFSAGPTPDWENFSLDELVHLMPGWTPPAPEPTPTEGGSMERTEAWLRDMYSRQGVHAPGGAFWDYALKVAREQGRVILPQPVAAPGQDDIPANYNYPPGVLAYTMPPLYWEPGKEVTEGFPKA